MALTTHEKIRKYAGLQEEFIRQPFQNDPDSGSTLFYVTSDYNYRVIPYLSTGNTVAGISDVRVYAGLSGIAGMSQLTVTVVDPELGYIGVDTAVNTGVSLVVNYSSSSVSSDDIEQIRLEAENIVNRRLSICYDTLLSPTPSSVTSLATRLSSALLLIRGYGTMGQDTSRDGYALYGQIMGDNQAVANRGDGSEVLGVGELGLICTENFELTYDDGSIVPKNTDGAADAGNFIPGGDVRGRLNVIQDEEFRFKNWGNNQPNTNKGGSGRGRGNY